MFKCPNCPHVEYSSCKAFQTCDIDVKQHCNVCTKHSCVKDWKCECGEYLHNCTTHRHASCIADVHRSMKRETSRQIAKRTSQTRRAKVARTKDPMSYEDMSAEDDRNAKRRREEDNEWFEEPSFDLGFRRIKTIRVSSLGPILKKRFVCAM